MNGKIGLLIGINPDFKERSRWYVAVRWLFLLSIILPGTLSNYFGEGLSPQVKRDVTLGLLALASNLIMYLLVRRNTTEKYYRNLSIMLLIIDIVTITVLIFIKGGVESRSPILYTIPLLMASSIFGRTGIYYSAGFCLVLYNSLIIADWLNIVQSINAINPGLRYNTTYVFNTIAFFTSTLIVISLLADFITRLLTEKEKLAKTSAEALEEAQKIARIGSWSWDIPSDKISWSKQLYSMFEIEPKNFKGTFSDYLGAVHPDDVGVIKEAVERGMQNGAALHFEHRIKTSNGIVWLRADGEVKLDDSGKILLMQGTAQDITSQKRAELATSQKTEELTKINSFLIGRELKMIELKKEIASLKDTRT